MKTLSAAMDFQTTNIPPAANSLTDCFFRMSYRKAIYWAYSLAAKANQWSSYQFHINDDFVCLETFLPNGKPHRAITMWHNVDRDNSGYLFSVQTAGHISVFQTNKLQHALGNFKTPRPVLSLSR